MPDSSFSSAWIPKEKLKKMSNLNLLPVWNVESSTAVYKSHIYADPMFLTADAVAVLGFFAVVSCVVHVTLLTWYRNHLQDSFLSLSRLINVGGQPTLAKTSEIRHRADLIPIRLPHTIILSAVRTPRSVSNLQLWRPEMLASTCEVTKKSSTRLQF